MPPPPSTGEAAWPPPVGRPMGSDPAAPIAVPPVAGWYPDGGGRFAYRYWDGAAWTGHVRGERVAAD